jgi:hypothetical protein
VLIKTDRVVAGTVIVINTRLSCEYLTSPNSFNGVASEVDTTVTVVTGIDIQPIDEVKDSLAKFGDRYLKRLFSDLELIRTTVVHVEGQLGKDFGESWRRTMMYLDVRSSIGQWAAHRPRYLSARMDLLKSAQYPMSISQDSKVGRPRNESPSDTCMDA